MAVLNILLRLDVPVQTCHANRRRLRELRVMWAVRAASLPLVMAGTREAAVAHSTTIAAPAYKCGPGKSLPESHMGPSTQELEDFLRLATSNIHLSRHGFGQNASCMQMAG
jgi:hypothetical protein